MISEFLWSFPFDPEFSRQRGQEVLDEQSEAGNAVHQLQFWDQGRSPQSPTEVSSSRGRAREPPFKPVP